MANIDFIITVSVTGVISLILTLLIRHKLGSRIISKLRGSFSGKGREGKALAKVYKWISRLVSIQVSKEAAIKLKDGNLADLIKIVTRNTSTSEGDINESGDT
jgi:hypothetical protein